MFTAWNRCKCNFCRHYIPFIDGYAKLTHYCFDESWKTLRIKKLYKKHLKFKRTRIYPCCDCP